MVQTKTRSFPTELKMDSTFDIFKRLPDGNSTCIAAVRGVAQARRRINRLAKVKYGRLFDPLSGARVLDPTSEKRLARTLLLPARYGGPGQPKQVFPKVSQEMLAEMIGTTRSRVNSLMNKFRKLGFTKYNGEIHVDSSLMRVALHE
jgi:CRP-like cAMP-binding protein